MERSTIFNGKTHYKWPFSIAMLNYQRVGGEEVFQLSGDFSSKTLWL